MAEEGVLEKRRGRQLMGTRLAAARLLLACAAGILLAAGASAAPKDKGPQWASLTVEQQQVLAPLAADWDKHLTREQKVKWVGIAKRYPAMTPQGQKRVQTRMQKWAKLTPGQREQARVQYRSLGKMAPDNREELRRHWAEYQSLPPHEKRMFDVPPNYVPPAQRRQRSTAPSRPKPPPPSDLPASL